MKNKDTRTFKIDPGIEMKPVRFKNRFGIELAGHLYLPENYEAQKNAAIIVAGPFGAVKEQASGLTPGSRRWPPSQCTICPVI